MYDFSSITPAKIKKTVILIIAGLILCTLAYVLLTYGWMKITIDSNETTPTKVVLVDRDGQAKEYSFNGTKTLFLKKGAYQITANQENKETITAADVKFSRAVDVPVTMQPEKEVTKLPELSQGCGGVLENNYYSYNCFGNTEIFKHTTFTNTQFSSKSPVGEDAAYRSLVPYKSGLIATEFHEDEVKIIYVNLPSGKKESIFISPPAAVSYDLEVVPNISSTNNDTFLLVDKEKGDVYSYTSLQDNSPKKVYSLSNKDLLIGSSVYQNDNLVMHITPPGEVEGEITPEENSKAKIITKTLSNSEEPKEWRIDATLDIAKIISASKNSFTINTLDNRLVTLSQTGDDRLRVSSTIYDVTSAATSGDLVYIIQGNSIYSYDRMTVTAHRLFSSDNLSLSRISALNNTVTFTAFANNASQAAALPYAYIINNEPATYPRPEWYIPFDDTSLVRRFDYDNKRLYVSLRVTSLGFERSTGKAFYDQQEFDSLRQKVQSKLQKEGLGDRFETIFTY